MSDMSITSVRLTADDLARIEAEEIARANIRERLLRPRPMSQADSFMVWAVATFVLACAAIAGIVVLIA